VNRQPARLAALLLAGTALLVGCGGAKVPHTLPASEAGHITTVTVPADPAPHATVAVGEPIAVQVSTPAGHTIYFSVSPTGTAELMPQQRDSLEQIYLAKSAGTAVVEVSRAPQCTPGQGCPDHRMVIGTVRITVTK
jgi:hypothetical protein